MSHKEKTENRKKTSKPGVKPMEDDDYFAHCLVKENELNEAIDMLTADIDPETLKSDLREFLRFKDRDEKDVRLRFKNEKDVVKK